MHDEVSENRMDGSLGIVVDIWFYSTWLRSNLEKCLPICFLQYVINGITSSSFDDKINLQ